MLLNELRNHELYPYIRNLRKQDAPVEVSFVALDLLQKNIDSDDSRLEKQLYGTDQKFVYSGLSWKSFCDIATQCGFETPKKLNEDGVVVRAKLNPGKWTSVELKRSVSEQRTQKIWAFRKNLRKRAKEFVARVKALTKPSPFKHQSELWLNLGAGEESYPKYLKIDLSGDQHVFDNIVTLSRVPNDSVEKIYCNHVLEHIPSALVATMLKRWREVLKPGGKVLARAPDARQAVLHLNEEWKEVSQEKILSLGFPNYLAREANHKDVLDDISCIQTVYGWSASTPYAWDISNQHKSLWTPNLARKRFEEAGFQVELSENLGSIQTVVVARK